MLVAAVAGGVLAGAGGFYMTTQLTAQVVNKDQTVTVGTLILSNRVGTGAACLSAPDLVTDGNEQVCDAAFDLDVRKPGDTATAHLEIANVGALDAGGLRVFAASCADSDAAPFHGSGSPCASLQLYIQLWTDPSRSIPAACVYGGSPDGKRCDFSDRSRTIGAFASTHASAQTAVLVGSLPAGARDILTIGVRLPEESDNSLQGRRATTSFSWHLTQ